ncbi:MAG TPA: hypothetical protein VF708_22380 [Pyrinomonadaceae bacterium]|jgi:hypothetical protein
MNQQTNGSYWEPSYETYYRAYFQELASEALVGRWQQIDFVTAFFVAATASGSAITGLSFWSKPGWITVWGSIAVVVSLTSIAHGAVKVPERLKEQEERRRLFAKLRVDVETFRQQLRIGLTAEEADKRYAEIRTRYAQYTENLRPDLADTERLRLKVQKTLNNILEEYIRHE